MVEKISYDTLLSMLKNVDIPEEEIAQYINAVPSENGAFNIKIVPNPERVLLTEDERAYEDGLSFANGIARYRRSVRFNHRLKDSHYNDWPVLVSEGDSWFQFPLLTEDIIDHLSKNYLINCLSAAGDTAQNMVNGPLAKEGQEYFSVLKKQVRTGRLQGFLFSAAGNDVIGEDPATKESILAMHLNETGNEANPITYINNAKLTETMQMLKGYYKTVIDNIRNDDELHYLPIFIHGYDYCFPGGHKDDPRTRQLYAKRDQWLGRAFKEKGILQGQRDKQREVIRFMIDSLYEMLSGFADDNVHIVDVRGTLNNITDWKDEIHGTNEGFQRVAMKFDHKIQNII